VPEQTLAEAAPAEAEPRTTRGAALLSVASALPEKIVTNAEIAARIGKTDEWIYTRTGIRERRHAQPHEQLSDFCAQAGRLALERAGVDPLDVDLVLLGTLTADQVCPAAAPIVADAIGAHRAGAMDVGAACTGFLSTLALGAAQVETGRARYVLAIGADFVSRITDQTSKVTAMLFADGAGAVVLGPTDGPARVGPVILRADGSHARTLYAPIDTRLIEMDGHETFKHAVNRMSETTREAVAAAGLTLEEIDLFVYHQANGRILRAVAERLELDESRIVDCIELTGNMSAGTVPYALDVARAEGRLRAGARVLLSAFGAGFTWGAGVVTLGADHA
jgi:3-oxoacyl-[acyl-carrier-protein] synthase-3